MRATRPLNAVGEVPCSSSYDTGLMPPRGTRRLKKVCDAPKGARMTREGLFRGRSRTERVESDLLRAISGQANAMQETAST